MQTVFCSSYRSCAFPHFFFLVDLHNLGLWEPLHALVTAEKSTPGIQVQALWVIGTALQNNPAAQDVVCDFKIYRRR